MNKRELILNLLRECPRTNWELCQLAKTARYGGRIFELRRAGYEITEERIERAVFRYTLVAEPEPIKIESLPTENQMELL